ncbi:MAG: YccS family putative transporter [Polaromonas sp.]
MNYLSLTGLDERLRRARQRTQNHEGYTRGARALVALTCVLIFDWLSQRQGELMPVLLGVMASALTETDDNWQGRLRAQLITMVAFTLVALAVWLTLPWPALLLAVLLLSAFTLTMLGALGERYRAIAFGAMVLFIYSALAAQTGHSQVGISTPLMLAGAVWYGLVSVLWSVFMPQAPVRHRLSKLYALLGQYLHLKAQLLEPVREVDLSQRRMALVLHNARVVDALNATKESLFSRLSQDQPPSWLLMSMQQYLAAQDIHERASSSHEDYQVLSTAFFHSDALYRCQRVLTLLGEQAFHLAIAIRAQTVPVHQGATARSIEDLHAAIHHLGGLPSVHRSLPALNALSNNLTAMTSVFVGALKPVDPADGIVDQSLLDHQPGTSREAWSRIRGQLQVKSPLFRHAIRLVVSLAVGFCIMLATHDPHGYWILLTILFVSQQQYAATLTRLMQRIMGTALGLSLGWALIQLFPIPLMQSALIVVLGAVYLGCRHTRYLLATVAVSALLLLSFHQMGMGQGVIPTRLLDTVVGSVIAGLAAWLVLPNWHLRQWPGLAARALRTQAIYLHEILAQYQAPTGKQDNLSYRLARRKAHNADAALSSAYSAMLKEPSRGGSAQKEASGRFLICSHTLLNYISAIGAHRDELVLGHVDAGLLATAETLQRQLDGLALALERPQDASSESLAKDLPPQIAGVQASDDVDAMQRFLQTQLQLALQLVPDLMEQVTQMTQTVRIRRPAVVQGSPLV